MNNSFNIGEAVSTILMNDKDVAEKVNDRIYPLIADDTPIFPFIIYQRSGFTPYNTKDNSDENVLVDMVIAADDYGESVDIATKVRKALEHKCGTFSDISVQDIIIEDASEDYIDNTFIQSISIRVFLDNN